MGSADPLKNGRKIKTRKHAKKSSFLCLCYILRAIRAGRCRERRYADHTFIQIYFRMHHFVVKFSNFLRLKRQGGIDPPPDQNPAGVSARSSQYSAPLSGVVRSSKLLIDVLTERRGVFDDVCRGRLCRRRCRRHSSHRQHRNRQSGRQHHRERSQCALLTCS